MKLLKWLICLFKGHKKEFMPKDCYELYNVKSQITPWRCERCDKHYGYEKIY